MSRRCSAPPSSRPCSSRRCSPQRRKRRRERTEENPQMNADGRRWDSGFEPQRHEGHEDTRKSEKERMEWLAAYLPVPRVLGFEEHDARQCLLMSALPGRDASDRFHSRDMPRLVRLLAEGIRCFHALPVADCPFDHRLDVMMAEA